MAITITNLLNEKEWLATAAGVTHTTASFTPSSNVLLAIGVTCVTAGGPPSFTLSQSGGLTCSKRVTGVEASSSVYRLSQLWTIPVVTGASMTLTIGITGGDVFSGDGVASGVSISEIAGYDSAGSYVGLTIGYTDAGSHSGTLSYSLGGTSASDSAVVSTISCDGDYGDGVVPGGSGWTELYKTTAAMNGWFRHTTEYVIGATSNILYGSFVDNWGHTSCAMEIKAAGGGGGPTQYGRVGMQNSDEGFAGSSHRMGSLHPIGKGIVGWRKGLIVPKRRIIRVTHTDKRAA